MFQLCFLGLNFLSIFQFPCYSHVVTSIVIVHHAAAEVFTKEMTSKK